MKIRDTGLPPQTRSTIGELGEQIAGAPIPEQSIDPLTKEGSIWARRAQAWLKRLDASRDPADAQPIERELRRSLALALYFYREVKAEHAATKHRARALDVLGDGLGMFYAGIRGAEVQNAAQFVGSSRRENTQKLEKAERDFREAINAFIAKQRSAIAEITSKARDVQSAPVEVEVDHPYMAHRVDGKVFFDAGRLAAIEDNVRGLIASGADADNPALKAVLQKIQRALPQARMEAEDAEVALRAKLTAFRDVPLVELLPSAPLVKDPRFEGLTLPQLVAKAITVLEETPIDQQNLVGDGQGGFTRDPQSIKGAIEKLKRVATMLEHATGDLQLLGHAMSAYNYNYFGPLLQLFFNVEHLADLASEKPAAGAARSLEDKHQVLSAQPGARPAPKNVYSIREPTQEQATILGAIDRDESGYVDRDEARRFLQQLVDGAAKRDTAKLQEQVLAMLEGGAELGPAIGDAARQKAAIEVPAAGKRSGDVFARVPWFSAATMQLVDRQDDRQKQTTTVRFEDAAKQQMEVTFAWEGGVIRFQRPGETIELDLHPDAAAELARKILAAVAKQGLLSADADAYQPIRAQVFDAFDRAALLKTPKGFTMQAGLDLSGALDPREDLHIIGEPPKGLEKLAWLQGGANGFGIDIRLFRAAGDDGSGPIFASYQNYDPEQQRFLTSEPKPINRFEAQMIRDALARSTAGGFRHTAFYKGLQARAVVSGLNHRAAENVALWEASRTGKMQAISSILEILKKHEMEPAVRLNVARTMQENQGRDLTLPAEARKLINDYVAEVERAAGAAQN